MKDRHSDLVGMFLVLDSTDHEHYRTGQIVAAVGHCYLIQFDTLEAGQPLPPSNATSVPACTKACSLDGRAQFQLYA